MATDEIRVPYKCGRDGTEWEAVLKAEGAKFRFFSFAQQGKTIETPQQTQKTDIAQRWREAQQAFATKPPLPAPPQVEFVNRQVTQKLTADQLTRFGFVCPSCKDLNPLLCLECRKFSCHGGPKDLAGRIQCIWCGETLEFVPRAPGEPKPPPAEIDVTEKRVQARTRELPPGEKNQQ